MIQHFDIRLTTQELDYIANILAQQPWAQVNTLLANIKGQIDMAQKLDQMRPVGEAIQERPQQVNGALPS